jgi:hypothetical protein
MTQYCIDDNYVTLFGEFHSRVPILFDPSTGIRIDDFILDRIEKNPSTRVLLEYHPIFNPLTIGSININHIYGALSCCGLTDKIIPFDYKYYFVDVDKYFKLFNINEFTKFSNTDIRNFFIEPFFDKSKHDAFVLDSRLYTQDAYEYLMMYLKNIENRLGYLFTDIALPQDKKVFNTNDLLRYELVSDWTDMADFFMLKEILKNIEMEYIIIVGDKHRQNIQKVFNNFPRLFESSGELAGAYEPVRRISKSPCGSPKHKKSRN